MSRPTGFPRRTSRLSASLIAFTLGLFAALVPATAASAVGTITGTVLDQLEVPVVGVTLQVSQRTGGSAVFTPTTDADGEFEITGAPDGTYEIYLQEGSAGTGGQRFSVIQEFVTVAGGAVDKPDIETARYVTISGTITNWVAEMGDVRATLYMDYGNSVDGPIWQQVNIYPPAIGTASGSGAFTILAPVFARSYTIGFIGEDYGTPFVDSFLGGAFDPESATHFTGDPGQPIAGITTTLAPAASISGRVTSEGVGLAGIDIEVEVPGGDYDYDYVVTDAHGYYTAYVRPGPGYRVTAYGDADHADMVYDGWDGCGCEFDPVTTTLAEPAVDIDFALVPWTSGKEILGIVAEDVANPNLIDDIEVRLFESVNGIWTLADVVESDGNGPSNFGFLLADPGRFRLQFAADTGTLLQVVDGLHADVSTGTGVAFDPVPACYADLGLVADTIIVYAIVDPATAAGACGSIAGTAASTGGSTGGSSGGAGSIPPRPRSQTAATAVDVTPTPTPTASASPTPSPTTSPAPSASPSPEPAPASAPDLWWLLWLVFGIVVVAIVGGVIWFARRN